MIFTSKSYIQNWTNEINRSNISCKSFMNRVLHTSGDGSFWNSIYMSIPLPSQLQYTINKKKCWIGEEKKKSNNSSAKSIDKMPMTLIKMILKTIMRANDEMNPMKLRLKSNNKMKTNNNKKTLWIDFLINFACLIFLFLRKMSGFFIFVYLMFDFIFWWCCASNTTERNI